MKNFSYQKIDRTVLLKKLDWVVGKRLIKFLPSVCDKEFDLKDLSKILIIRPGGLGDGVLLLPSILLLKKRYPHIQIHILAEKRNASVFELVHFINKKDIFLYHKISHLYKVFSQRYDVVVDTEQWHYLSAILASFIKARYKIGFASNERMKLFHFKVPYSQKEYEVLSFLKLFKPILKDTDFDFTSSFLEMRKKAQKDQYVVLFPGATVKERMWPKENFKEIADWLDKKGIKVVVVGGKSEVKLGEYIVQDTLKGINLANKTSLKETAEILANSRLLLTVDSGIMHLAFAVGTPVVALFGPGIEEKWAPKGKNSIIINKHLPCSPCTKFGYTPPCVDNRCMKEISVKEVKEAIDAIFCKTHSSCALD